jgi:hypothetical protein
MVVDPISITSLSLQVAEILFSITSAIVRTYRDGKTVHRSLSELQEELDAIYELSDNINRLFRVETLVEAIKKVQQESGIDLLRNIERPLDHCLEGAHRLLDILTKLGLPMEVNGVKRTYVQWRLDRRLDDIDRIKSNFLGYRSSIQLAFQTLTM